MSSQHPGDNACQLGPVMLTTPAGAQQKQAGEVFDCCRSAWLLLVLSKEALRSAGLQASRQNRFGLSYVTYNEALFPPTPIQ